jgi:hypothetical protein
MRILLWSLFTIATFFLAGYWIGTHPHYYDRYLDLTKSEVVFYSQEPDTLFPVSFRTEIQSQSPTKIKFISDSPETADVLLVDTTFIKTRSLIPSLKNSDWMSLFDKVSPDFQLEIFKSSKAIPVLWKENKGKLRILSLITSARANVNKEKMSHLDFRLIQFILNRDFHLRWMKYHDWNSALLKMDESSLDEKRKASFLRQLNLEKIELQ